LASPFVRRLRLGAELRALRQQRGLTAERLGALLHQSRMKIAREAAAKGWWDAYGDAMGDRQRLYADIESGAATIREYHPSTLSGNLQTPEYTWDLIENAMAGGSIGYVPEKVVQARLYKQEHAFRPSGPEYEVILDEVGLRRFTVRPEVMRDQLHRLVKEANRLPQLTLRVFPFRTGRTMTLLPKSTLFLYTFADPADPFWPWRKPEPQTMCTWIPKT